MEDKEAEAEGAATPIFARGGKPILVLIELTFARCAAALILASLEVSIVAGLKCINESSSNLSRSAVSNFRIRAAFRKNLLPYSFGKFKIIEDIVLNPWRALGRTEEGVSLMTSKQQGKVRIDKMTIS